MLYTYNRPLNSARKTPNIAQFYQWRSFDDVSSKVQEAIESTFKEVKTETRLDKYFLVPGRKKIIPRMVNDEYFEVRSLVDDSGPLELWEQSVRTGFPMKRTFAAMITATIPRFNGSCNSVMTPDMLTESLARKSKYFEVKKNLRIFEKDDVRAEISDIKVDGEQKTSLALKSDKAEPLAAMLKVLGLSPQDNTNFAELLTAA